MEFKILFLVLVVVMVTVFMRLYMFNDSGKWPTAEGKIVRSVIAKSQYYAQESYGADVRKQNVLTTEYYLDLVYTYSVKGQSFEGRGIFPDFAGSNVLSLASKNVDTPIIPISTEENAYLTTYRGKSYSEKPAYAISPANVFKTIEDAALFQKQFPEGVSVPVHYNPKEPASSGLVTQGVSTNKFFVVIGSMVLLIGVAMFFALKFIFSR